MNRILRHITLPAILLAAGLLTGCGSAPVERFYTLNAPPPVQGQTAQAPYSVMLGPVGLPEMVDRPQLVVRTSANRVAVLEHQRWAESLKTAIPRVLAANLGAQLGGVTVSVPGDAAGRQAKYRVTVQIAQLDAEVDRAVTLNAAWSIRGLEGRTLLAGKTHVREATQGLGYDALVAAHERALVQLGADLAQGIHSVERAKP